jgi:hypothetical protein
MKRLNIGITIALLFFGINDVFTRQGTDNVLRYSMPFNLKLNSKPFLLHNTNAMTGIPGRTYDLPDIGWQQKHWSLAPERGLGRHRVWLPFVTTSHLNGIFGLMELNSELYQELSEKIILE